MSIFEEVKRRFQKKPEPTGKVVPITVLSKNNDGTVNIMREGVPTFNLPMPNPKVGPAKAVVSKSGEISIL